MDLKTALEKLPQEERSILAETIIFSAVRALILSHPDQSAVRRAFDEFYGQSQANVSVSGIAPAEERRVFSALIVAALFAPPPTF